METETQAQATQPHDVTTAPKSWDGVLVDHGRKGRPMRHERRTVVNDGDPETVLVLHAIGSHRCLYSTAWRMYENKAGEYGRPLCG